MKSLENVFKILEMRKKNWFFVFPILKLPAIYYSFISCFCVNKSTWNRLLFNGITLLGTNFSLNSALFLNKRYWCRWCHRKIFYFLGAKTCYELNPCLYINPLNLRKELVKNGFGGSNVMTLAMKQQTICLLLVIIVCYVNQCKC